MGSSVRNVIGKYYVDTVDRSVECLTMFAFLSNEDLGRISEPGEKDLLRNFTGKFVLHIVAISYLVLVRYSVLTSASAVRAQSDPFSL